jgi:hypothetical protein
MSGNKKFNQQNNNKQQKRPSQGHDQPRSQSKSFAAAAATTTTTTTTTTDVNGTPKFNDTKQRQQSNASAELNNSSNKMEIDSDTEKPSKPDTTNDISHPSSADYYFNSYAHFGTKD